MKKAAHVWIGVLAVTFVTALGAASVSAADTFCPSTAKAACSPAKATPDEPRKAAATKVRHKHLAVRLPYPRPHTIRLASRYVSPWIGYFPLYLGIAY